MAKKKRKLSAYNLHMSKEMKRGRTFKQAVASWKGSSSYRKPGLKKRVKRMWKKRESNPRRKRTMAKKNKSRSRGFLNTSTMFKFVRLGALAAPAAAELLGSGTPFDKAVRIGRKYTGYDMSAKTWKWQYLVEGWAPYLTSVLATHGIQKIAGILRRL